MRRLPVLTLLFLLPSAASRAQTPASQPAPTAGAVRELRVLFSADIFGRYAWPGCDERPADSADMSQMVTAVKRRREELKKAGKGEPLVLAGGSMVRPDVLGSYIFGEGKAWAPNAARLIRNVGFHAVSVGAYDFGAQPDTLRRYMELMRKYKIPLLAANVGCKKDDDFRCRHLGWKGRRYMLLEQGGVRVGIFALVRKDLTKRILARSRGSLKAKDPYKVATELNHLLRTREKADVVIALANLNVESTAPQDIIQFVRRLGPEAPDLVIANDMYNPQSDDFLPLIRASSGPPIVGTDRFGQHLGEAVIRIRRDESGELEREIKVVSHELAQEQPDRRSDRLVADIRRALCLSLTAQLGQATVKDQLSLDDFRRYLMEVMRTRHNAELAAINDSALADTSFPMTGAITAENILRAIRTETSVGTFRMTGANIIKKLGPFVTGSKRDLRVLGLTKKKKKWYVNNRLIDSGYHYRVATTAFVASGGDGLLSLYTEKFRDSEVSLRRLLADFFEQGGPALHDADPTVSLQSDFPDPWDRWLLYGLASAGLFFSNLLVDNSAAYNQPDLRKDNATSIRADLTLELGASNRNHAVEADLNLQYGHTWTRSAEPPEDRSEWKYVPAETLDRIRFDLLYRMTTWRNRQVPALWYMPVPYAEGTLLTEFTPSGCRDPNDCEALPKYHYMDLRGTVGAGLLVHPNLFFKLGFATVGELLTPDEAVGAGENKATVGIYAGYKLRRTKLNSSVHYPVLLESRLDFYFTDFGATLRREMIWESKFFISILPYFYVTAAHRMYVFDARFQDQPAGSGTGISNDISIGFEAMVDYRHQLF
jgi:2',3'-cyclic-nucleotide 2'-phosphodiesterase (5'-nucleotidase family)